MSTEAKIVVLGKIMTVMTKKGFENVREQRGYPIDFAQKRPFLSEGPFIGSI